MIAAPAGGITDMIADGMTGLLVPPGDPVQLAVFIRHLSDSSTLRARLAANACCFAICGFDSRRMAAKIEDLYTALIGRS